MLIPKARRNSIFDNRVSTVSLDFDGSTEKLANETNQLIGIANQFSILFVVKSDTDGANQRILAIKDSTERSEILLLKSVLANDLSFSIRDEDGTGLKSYRWDAPMPTGSWSRHLVTWDGTNIRMYLNGVLTPEDTIVTDATLDGLADRPRQIGIGFDVVEEVVGNWDGRIHHIIIWNTVLNQVQVTAAITSGYNPYLTDTAPYVKHWFRCGMPALGNMAGSTYVCDSVAVGGIDVTTNSANLTDADIVVDAP